MKRKCRKTHESILSKGRGTVIPAVCMATAMFALTACGGEQTGSAGSSENAGTGNPANSDAVSSGVDVANKESEEFHEEKGGAELPQPYAGYMEILEQIMTEGHDSNGREYDWNEPWNFEDNCFAILDVDNDGRQELLFNFNETCMADKCEVVYEYDEEADILREELATWISTDYYSNGIVKVDESHNHGKDPTGRGGGSYMIYQYDEGRDSYQLLYSVDSWDGQIYEENFPDELDVDGDKLLYYVMVEEAGAVGNISGTMSAGVYVSTRSGDMIIFDGEEYSAWAEELMPEWSRIHVSYHRMTEDFMERVQGAYAQAAAYAAQADEWFVEWRKVSDVSDDYLLYDLDGDGDLELTVSVMQGTGKYSSNYFYDLDGNGKVTELELVKLCDSKECRWTGDFDIGDWLHIQAYQDDNGIIYYEGNDYCKDGMHGGYYENGFYYLKDGVVYQDSIRRRTKFLHKEDGQEDETHYYSITLDEGEAAIDQKEVTEEQYEAIREEYIKEMAEISVYQNWSYFRWDEIAQGEISEEAICRKLFESALGSEFCLCNASALSEKEMPVMVDILIGDDYYVALYEDGSVWSWGNNESSKLGVRVDETKVPQKVDITDSVVKIMDGGRTIWALTDAGDIYIWGEAYLREPEKGKRLITQKYIIPEKLEDIPPIEKLSVRNSHAVAVGYDGEMYLWGVIDPPEYIPPIGTTKIILEQVPEDFRGLVTGVQDMEIGGGRNYYFMREDGTVFSIMSRLGYIDKGYGYIFPNGNEEQKDITYYWADEISDAVILGPEDEYYDCALYYECQNITGADMISSDEYTMFLYKDDATLWYWMSDRVKYHSRTWLSSHADDGLEHGMGHFEAVNIREIMNLQENEPIPQIVDMFSNFENTLFLTSDGELFMSSYVTDRVEDVEFYVKFNPDPGRLPLVETRKDVELKRIAFEQLNYHDIVRINGDGQYNFSAVDSKGNYYHIRVLEE